MSLARNVGKNKNRNLSGKCSQKLLDHAKQCATDAFKAVLKTAEATGDLIVNNIANKIIKISKTSQQNN